MQILNYKLFIKNHLYIDLFLLKLTDFTIDLFSVTIHNFLCNHFLDVVVERRFNNIVGTSANTININRLQNQKKN